MNWLSLASDLLVGFAGGAGFFLAVAASVVISDLRRRK